MELAVSLMEDSLSINLDRRWSDLYLGGCA